MRTAGVEESFRNVFFFLNREPVSWEGKGRGKRGAGKKGGTHRNLSRCQTIVRVAALPAAALEIFLKKLVSPAHLSSSLFLVFSDEDLIAKTDRPCLSRGEILPHTNNMKVH